MDVRGLGTGPTSVEISSALRGLAETKGQVLAAIENLAQSGDTITEILKQLSEPEVVKFLETIEHAPRQENAAQLDELFRASISAAADGNVQQALVTLTEFAALDPRRAETLEREPGLASIRPEVGQLLSRLASAAHVDAESRLAQATHLLETIGSKEGLSQEFKPQIAILIADRLLSAGGYANWVRSAEFSQISINQYAFVPAYAPLSSANPRSIPVGSERADPGLRNPWMTRIRKLWRRAPLLVLLLAWLAAGFVGGSISAILLIYWPQRWPGFLVASGFEVWGVGFLALVAFGFYVRVRNVRW
jgi:hypothetical protein